MMKELAGGRIRKFTRRFLAVLTIPVLIAAVAAPKLYGYDYYWDPTPTTSPLGGSGTWDTTSAYWRPGSPDVSPTFFPANGPDNDVILQGSQGTLAIVSGFAFNDLYAGPSGGGLFSLSGALGSILLDGAAASQLEVASSSTLQISTRLLGMVPFEKLGMGILTLDNASNNFTGGVLLRSGSLNLAATSINTLRSTPIDLAAGTTLGGTTGATVKIGTLTGDGSISIGSSTLYVNGFGAADPASAKDGGTYLTGGPLYSGTIAAASLNISGAGGSRLTLPGGSVYSVQTFNGTLSGITNSLTVNSGAALTIVSGAGGSGGAIGTTAIYLRGGALVMDSTKGSGGTSYGRVQNTATNTLQSAGLALIGGPLGSDESTGSLRPGSGASTISVIQPSANLARLTFSTLDRTTDKRSTIDFRGVGGTLGSIAGPQIVVSGLSGALDPWATVNGADYATATTTGIAALSSYSALGASPTTGNSANYYSTTGSAVFAGTSAFAARGIKLAPDSDGRSFSLTNTGDINTTGILLTGTRDFLIAGTGTGGVSGANPRYFGVTDSKSTLTIATAIKSPGVDIVKYGSGTLNLTGNNTPTLGSGSYTNIVINAGILRATVNGALASLPQTSLTMQLRGGVLEIASGGSGLGTSADYRGVLGIGAGKVNWATDTLLDEGSGGFSAWDQDATVNIGGSAAPATLAWNSTYFVHNGHALILGSTRASARTILLNPVALDDGTTGNSYFAREVRVAENSDSLITSDVARISGTISGGINVDLLKTGAGTLELTGSNTFTGNALVQEGTLQLGASDGAGAGSSNIISSSSKIIVRGTTQLIGGTLVATSHATLRLGGDPGVTSRINDTAALVLEAGEFDTGGFSETLGTLIVSQAECILDLGGSGILQFGSVADHSWSGTLVVVNWHGSETGGGTNQLRIGTSASDIRPDQLTRVSMYSDFGQTLLGTAVVLPTGELVPIPEPAPILAVVGGAAILIARRRRRQRIFR